MKTCGLVLLLTTVLILGGADEKPQSIKRDAQAGKMLPNFELEDLDGVKVTLKEFRGHPVVLGFWALM